MKFLLLVLKIINLFLTAILMTVALVLVWLFGTILYNLQNSDVPSEPVPATCEYYEEC